MHRPRAPGVVVHGVVVPGVMGCGARCRPTVPHRGTPPGPLLNPTLRFWRFFWWEITKFRWFSVIFDDFQWFSVIFDRFRVISGHSGQDWPLPGQDWPLPGQDWPLSVKHGYCRSNTATVGQTLTNTDKHWQTRINSDKPRQTRTNSDKPRQTRTNSDTR